MPTQKTRRNANYGYPGPQVGFSQEPIISNRAPTTYDSAELGTIWVNTVTHLVWVLTFTGADLSGPINIWSASAGGQLATLTGQVGGAVSPDANNNINISGTHGINTISDPGTFTVFAAINNSITLGDISVIPSGSDALTISSGDLTISNNLNMTESTNQFAGVITMDSNRFIHTYGPNNTFVGVGAGNFTLTGSEMLGVGESALESITTGSYNVAIGNGALSNVTVGEFNTAVGYGSQVVLINGNNNTSLGYNTLFEADTSSSNNTAIGSDALSNATGIIDNNIAIGYNAASTYVNTESDNIIIGNIGLVGDVGALRIGTTGTQITTHIAGIDGVDVGSTAQVVTLGTGATADQLGTAVLTAGANVTITPGPNTITISSTGGAAGVTSITGNSGGPLTGAINIFTANATPRFVGAGTTETIDFNLPNLVLGSSLPSITSGFFNVGLGSAVLNAITSGESNVALGYRALTSLTTGFNNIAIGYNAGNFTQTGLRNILIGSNAGSNLTSATDSIYIGHAAGSFSANITATNNTIIGSNAGRNITTSPANVAIGMFSLSGCTSGLGTNTCVGFGSLGSLTTGSGNIAIGWNALTTLQTGTSNVVLGTSSGTGYNAAESNNICINNLGIAGESNVIRIGSAQTACYIDGIDGVDVGNTAKVVTLGTGGTVDQLGTATITAGSGITVTPTANTITIDVTPGAAVVSTITGNTGGAISPTTGNINIVTANSTAVFAGAVSTETLDFGITNLVLGDSLTSLTTGVRNVGLGDGVLTLISTADNNTAIGHSALSALVTGSSNIAIGYNAGSSYTGAEGNNITIGNIGVIADSGITRIGTNATHTACYIAGIENVDLSTAELVTIASDQLGSVTLTAGTNITITPGVGILTIDSTDTAGVETITGNSGGALTGSNINIVTANSTVLFAGAVATETLDFGITNLVLGSSLPALAGGLGNVGIGSGVLAGITSGSNNIAVGFNAAGTSTITGDDNIGIGRISLSNITSGINNIALGAGALSKVVTTNNNVALGHIAGRSITGANNVALGYNTLGLFPGSSSGSENIAIGDSAMSATAVTGNDNIGIGRSVFPALTSGANNIAIGSTAGGTLTTGSNNTYLGYGVNAAAAGEANTIRIGNTSNTGAYIMPLATSTTNIGGRLIVNGGQIFASGTASISTTTPQQIVSITNGSPNEQFNIIFTINMTAVATSISKTYAITKEFGTTAASVAAQITFLSGCSNGSGSDFDLAYYQAANGNIVLGVERDDAVASTLNWSVLVTVGDTIASSATVSAVSGAFAGTAVIWAKSNTMLGYQTGKSYILGETHNICIGAYVIGTASETGTTRIGAAQTACFIDGIDGVDVGNTAKVVTMGAGGTVDKLGTATITAGAGISITPTANTITVAATGISIMGATNNVLNATAGVTYVGLFTNNTTADATLATNQIVIPRDGTINYMYVNATANANTAAGTYTLNKNGSNQTLVVTVTASTTGVFSDLVHPISVSAGDLIVIESSQATDGTTTGSITLGYIPS